MTQPACSAGMTNVRGGTLRTRVPRDVPKRVGGFCADVKPVNNLQFDTFVLNAYTAYVLKEVKAGRTPKKISEFLGPWEMRFPRGPYKLLDRVETYYHSVAKALCESYGKRLPTISEAVFLLESNALPYVNKPAQQIGVQWMTNAGGNGTPIVENNESTREISIERGKGNTASIFCVK
jgi:hypothetical protein